jgi:hypothetical protein
MGTTVVSVRFSDIFYALRLTALQITAAHTLYPPSHLCLKPDCVRMKKGLLLKKAEARQAVLYTLSNGARPAYSLHLYCEGKDVISMTQGSAHLMYSLSRQLPSQFLC